MRLIKPTTLLLLMAITCGTGSPQGGGNGASGGSGAAPTKEQQCTSQNCGAELANCFKDPKCKKIFLCATGAKDITQSLNCGVDPRARAIVQCAADAKCFSQKDTCPTKLGLSNNQQKQPDLVKLMAEAFWHAVATNSKKPRNYFNFGCNKLGVVGSKKDGVGIVLSICANNETGGECVTPFFTFFGQGNQRGDTEVIEAYLKNGPFVIQPSKLYIKVDTATDDFAVVSSCLATPKDIRESDTHAIFSRYKTYQETLAKSGNAVRAEQALKYVLNKIGLDLKDFHKINASLCEN